MNTDKELIRERFAAGFKRYDRLALVQQRICDRLASLLSEVADGMTPRNGLEVGVGTGFLTRRLLPLFPHARWTLNDIVPAAKAFTDKYTGGYTVEYLWGDAECVVFPKALDLVVSASTVQWFNDLRGFVARVSASLCSGGILALSTFGGDNFREIRATTGEGLEYYTMPALERMLLDADFRILHAEEYTESLLFDTPVDVLHHIKATGVNSLRKVRWGRRQIADFDASYRDRFALTDGRVPLTYHPILLIARRM